MVKKDQISEMKTIAMHQMKHVSVTLCHEIYRHANLRDKKSGRPTGRGLWGPPTPPIGVRGDAPVGAQGAKPPEVPGFMRILK